MKKGFTLIELLVVVAIIGLLSSVVLSALQDARENAQWSKFDSTVLEIKKAVQLYRENNGGDWPPSFVAYQTYIQLLPQLKAQNLLSLDSIDFPPGMQEYLNIRPGGKTSTSDEVSCGTSVTSDDYYAMYIVSGSNPVIDVNDKSSIFKDMYIGGAPAANTLHCVSFR